MNLTLNASRSLKDSYLIITCAAAVAVADTAIIEHDFCVLRLRRCAERLVSTCCHMFKMNRTQNKKENDSNERIKRRHINLTDENETNARNQINNVVNGWR